MVAAIAARIRPFSLTLFTYTMRMRRTKASRNNCGPKREPTRSRRRSRRLCRSGTGGKIARERARRRLRREENGATVLAVRGNDQMPLDAPNLRYARREMSPKLVRARALATEIEELLTGLS